MSAERPDGQLFTKRDECIASFLAELFSAYRDGYELPADRSEPQPKSYR